jgi:hypothetical protein
MRCIVLCCLVLFYLMLCCVEMCVVMCVVLYCIVLCCMSLSLYVHLCLRMCVCDILSVYACLGNQREGTHRNQKDRDREEGKCGHSGAPRDRQTFVMCFCCRLSSSLYLSLSLPILCQSASYFVSCYCSGMVIVFHCIVPQILHPFSEISSQNCWE